MLRVGDVAIPATAGCVTVPASVPPPGLLLSASVTGPVNPVAVLPRASRAVTWTAGVNAAPAVEVVGATVKRSWVAGPGMTVKLAHVASVSPGAVARSV